MPQWYVCMYICTCILIVYNTSLFLKYLILLEFSRLMESTLSSSNNSSDQRG